MAESMKMIFEPWCVATKNIAIYHVSNLEKRALLQRLLLFLAKNEA
jgi:hypothetical protein